MQGAAQVAGDFGARGAELTYSSATSSSRTPSKSPSSPNVATLEAKRLADDAALDAARVPQCFRPLNDPITEPLAAAASRRRRRKKPAASGRPLRRLAAHRRGAAPPARSRHDVRAVGGGGGRHARPSGARGGLLVDSHWGARFSADFQSPSERVPLRRPTSSRRRRRRRRRRRTSARPTSFSTPPGNRRTIDDVASDATPR